MSLDLASSQALLVDAAELGCLEVSVPGRRLVHEGVGELLDGMDPQGVAAFPSLVVDLVLAEDVAEAFLQATCSLGPWSRDFRRRPVYPNAASSHDHRVRGGRVFEEVVIDHQ